MASKRKEHTSFYFNEEVDQALRKCDEARAETLKRKWLKRKEHAGS